MDEERPTGGEGQLRERERPRRAGGAAIAQATLVIKAAQQVDQVIRRGDHHAAVDEVIAEGGSPKFGANLLY